MRSISRYVTGCAVFGAMLCGPNCSDPPTQKEIVAGLIADETIDNEEAVEKIGRAIFSVKEAEVYDFDGPVHATFEIYCTDSSSMPAGVDLGRDKTGKRIDVGMTCFYCVSFIKAARQRGLAELDLKLNTAAHDGSGRRVWLPVYRFVLKKENFDKFIDMSGGGFTDRDIKRLEKIIEVKADAFSQFKYR